MDTLRLSVQQGSIQFVQRWVDSLPRDRDFPSVNSSFSSDLSSGLSSLSHGRQDQRLPDPSHNLRATRGQRFNEEETIQRGKLVWMHSNYSSINSDSSIDALLEERKVNPEEILMNAGFGTPDDSLASRLPARFLSSQTKASGIDLTIFIKDHPELRNCLNNNSSAAIGELYSRLPSYYHNTDPKHSYTSLHHKLTIDRQESYLPSSSNYAMHKSDNGILFPSILSKSNVQELAKQGFYEHPAATPDSSRVDSCTTPLSYHDCTTESSGTPSPILLNNTTFSSRGALSKQTSLGSDSVFSSADDFSLSQKLRARLEAIQEVNAQEATDELELGISFVPRSQFSSFNYETQSDGELHRARTRVNNKRKLFSKGKSSSFDDDHLYSSDSLSSFDNPDSPPLILTTSHYDDVYAADAVKVPAQKHGLLQVTMPESFDSVDSDTGTIVPSACASPKGLSPNPSRASSISIPPPLESFELEEVQSLEATSEISKRSSVINKRSYSEQSDSSGIADVDECVIACRSFNKDGPIEHQDNRNYSNYHATCVKPSQLSKTDSKDSPSYPTERSSMLTEPIYPTSSDESKPTSVDGAVCCDLESQTDETWLGRGAADKCTQVPEMSGSPGVHGALMLDLSYSDAFINPLTARLTTVESAGANGTGVTRRFEQCCPHVCLTCRAGSPEHRGIESYTSGEGLSGEGVSASGWNLRHKPSLTQSNFTSLEWDDQSYLSLLLQNNVSPPLKQDSIQLEQMSKHWQSGDEEHRKPLTSASHNNSSLSLSSCSDDVLAEQSNTDKAEYSTCIPFHILDTAKFTSSYSSASRSQLHATHSLGSLIATNQLSSAGSQAVSSSSSCVSLLSSQPCLMETKRKYEMKIAELETMKLKLQIEMKDAEINYWRSRADQDGSASTQGYTHGAPGDAHAHSDHWAEERV